MPSSVKFELLLAFWSFHRQQCYKLIPEKVVDRVYEANRILDREDLFDPSIEVHSLFFKMCTTGERIMYNRHYQKLLANKKDINL